MNKTEGYLRTECSGDFGQRRDEIMGEWRKLHNEELRDS
jgi:hypothetical protein